MKSNNNLTTTYKGAMDLSHKIARNTNTLGVNRQQGHKAFIYPRSIVIGCMPLDSTANSTRAEEELQSLVSTFYQLYIHVMVYWSCVVCCNFDGLALTLTLFHIILCAFSNLKVENK